MPTKIFLLKLQGPSPSAQLRDYILVLDQSLTLNEFNAELQELYPTINVADGKLKLLIEGSYPMIPRQFLRYMMTTVAYTPEVEGGVCVPKLLGGGNSMRIIYDSEKVFDGAEPSGRRQLVVTKSVPLVATMITLADAVDEIKIGTGDDKSLVLNSNSKIERQGQTGNGNRARPYPTHENTNHILMITIIQERHMSPLVTFRQVVLNNAPLSGDSQARELVKSEILARLPDWLDLSTVKLKLCHWMGDKTEASWSQDSFSWSVYQHAWYLHLNAEISW